LICTYFNKPLLSAGLLPPNDSLVIASKAASQPTVPAEQLLIIELTANADDSLDWGSGWRGKAQYVLIKQAGDEGDMGIEADNNEENNDALPRAQPLLANMTLIGPDGNPTQGAKFRRGTGVNVYNSVFSGFANYCIRLDGESTYKSGGTSANNLTGALTIAGSYVNCATNFEDKKSVGFTTEEWFTAQANNVMGDPLLNGIYPADNSPPLKIRQPIYR
jgi:hypothetical protein